MRERITGLATPTTRIDTRRPPCYARHRRCFSMPRLPRRSGGDARGMDVEAGSPTVTASQGGTAPAEYLRLAAIRDWRRVEHRAVLVPGGDQPDCPGNAGARPRCAGRQGG